MPYFITSTILFVAALVIIYWIHNQYHLDIVVTPASPPADAPLFSICIPARNEETNIGRCVEAALAQDYPNIEVIVLDDRSTDTTLTQLKEINQRIRPTRRLGGQTPCIVPGLGSGARRLAVLCRCRHLS